MALGVWQPQWGRAASIGFYSFESGKSINLHFRLCAARCLIIKDAEEEKLEKAVEAHCLITEDTVANGKNHEPIHP